MGLFAQDWRTNSLFFLGETNAYVGYASKLWVAHGVGDGKAIGSASTEVDGVGLCMGFVMEYAFACRAVSFVEDVEVEAVGAHGTCHLDDFDECVRTDDGECFLIHLLGCHPPMLWSDVYGGVLHEDVSTGGVDALVAHGVGDFLQCHSQLEVAVGVGVGGAHGEEQVGVNRFGLLWYIYK